MAKQAHCANNPSHHDRGTRRGQINYPVQPWAVGNPYPQTGKQRAEVRLRTRHARVRTSVCPPATCWQQKTSHPRSIARAELFYRTVNSAGVRLQCCRRARFRTSQACWTRYCCLPSCSRGAIPVAKSRRTRTVTRLEQANESRSPLLHADIMSASVGQITAIRRLAWGLVKSCFRQYEQLIPI